VSTVGTMLRDWRQRRRLSQLDLALEAGVSARHISFVETGRSRPSADMVLHLAAQLDVPLRERNRLLLAAGYAPVFAQNELDDPEMGAARAALDAILRGHEPNPALAVDRHWGMVAANRALPLLLEGVDPALLEPPVNVLRVALHPDGLAPRILNLGEWRAHLLERLGRQAVSSGDPALAALYDELTAYPGGADASQHPGELAVTLRIRAAGAELNLMSAITSFGTATEVTLSELAIESFFPADAATADVLRRAAAEASLIPAR
jgi:transcriptional regulator with XRE-family HTH domain